MKIKEYDLSEYINEDLEVSVDAILNEYGLLICKDHTKRVADYIQVLARKFGYDPEKAKIAALLHDISGVIPNIKRVEYCKVNHIDLIKEEVELPLIAHQKTSSHMAKIQFDIHDQEILSAIACHTTLKKDASKLDKLLFIADKIEWDQSGLPSYKKMVEDLLEDSLEEAIYAYMKYNLEGGLLKVVHPDYLEAVTWLEAELKNKTTRRVK
ncbi:HD domain-containing protein [Acidaminobacter sp. JC074]|uniref:bis(5'-nucleosyl)-tetraphosphatase (symmetrical) YqeK n=1 Tax=Acidaminobacter sp. JC074 TaxID=2530199 RepID=UPI001F1120F3|nr:bis(5'-nucleosyl)-tetraphosphatase (symmetrical) YqeK [Acidaminobacter sp. JC074]MCH4886253.1 HD domain-containing protein [Acidaminobacter sp. JC074]